MARPVRYETDLLAVRFGRWLQVVEHIADGVHDFDRRAFRIAADIVRLPRAAFGGHDFEGRAMVADMQPVAYVLAVAVYGQLLALQRVEDHDRHELLRKLVGPVIV